MTEKLFTRLILLLGQGYSFEKQTNMNHRAISHDYGAIYNRLTTKQKMQAEQITSDKSKTDSFIRGNKDLLTIIQAERLAGQNYAGIIHWKNLVFLRLITSNLGLKYFFNDSNASDRPSLGLIRKEKSLNLKVKIFIVLALIDGPRLGNSYQNDLFLLWSDANVKDFRLRWRNYVHL